MIANDAEIEVMEVDSDVDHSSSIVRWYKRMTTLMSSENSPFVPYHHVVHYHHQ